MNLMGRNTSYSTLAVYLPGVQCTKPGVIYLAHIATEGTCIHTSYTTVVPWEPDELATCTQ